MTDSIKVQVTFTVPANGTIPSYTDALYFDQDEYAALDAEYLEAMKQARYLSWVALVTAPPEPEPVVTPTETLTQAAELAQQAADLSQQAIALVQAAQQGA